MRRSFQGLLAPVQQIYRDQDHYSGDLFAFVNRRGNYVKILVWDRTGLVLFAKKPEGDRFVFPGESVSEELSDQGERSARHGRPG